MLLFAAGSGISPIRSAIESGALDGKDCTLYYGARDTTFMAYMDKFDEWEAKGVKVSCVGEPSCARIYERGLFL